MKRYVVLLLFVQIIWRTVAQITISTINSTDDAGTFIVGSEVTVVCEIQSYHALMNWKINSTKVAECTFTTCSSTKDLPGHYTFSHDTNSGIFNLTINPVQSSDNGQVLTCENENVNDTDTLTVTVQGVQSTDVSDGNTWCSPDNSKKENMACTAVITISIILFLFLVNVCIFCCCSYYIKKIGNSETSNTSKDTPGGSVEQGTNPKGGHSGYLDTSNTSKFTPGGSREQGTISKGEHSELVLKNHISDFIKTYDAYLEKKKSLGTLRKRDEMIRSKIHILLDSSHAITDSRRLKTAVKDVDNYFCEIPNNGSENSMKQSWRNLALEFAEQKDIILYYVLNRGMGWQQSDT